MKKDMRKLIITYVCILVAAVFTGFLTELCFHIRELGLEQDQKGILFIDTGEAEIIGFHDSGGELEFEQDSGSVSFDLGGRYIGKFIYAFDFAGQVNATVYIEAENIYGKTESLVTEDRCSSVLGESVININKKVHSIKLVFDQEELIKQDAEYLNAHDDVLTLKSFRIDNTIKINVFRIIFASVVCFLVLFILTERKRLLYRAELVFLIISLMVGTFMVFSLPSSKVGWDEEIHFMRAYSQSVYPSGMKMNQEMSRWFVSSVETWPFNVPDSIEEREAYRSYMNETCSYTRTELDIPSGANGTYVTGYLSQAIMIKIARLFHAPFTLLYQMGRLGNLLLYCGIMALAIKKTPCGKWIMTVIGLMPATLFQACVYSYDATVISFIYLALAYFLHMILTPDYRITVKDYLITGAVFVFGCLPKSVYAPFLLLGILLPKRIFSSKKQMYLMKAGVFAAFLLMTGMNILPTVVSPQETGDLRGGETSEAGQMSYILGQPFAYAAVLMQNMLRTLPDYFAGRSVFCLMGHLTASPYEYLIYGLVVAVIATDTVREGKNTMSVTGWWKAAFFVAAGLSAALIWTALYISYTVPGSIYIQGVQGRYYIPLLFPVYMVLNTNRIRNHIEESWYHVCICAVSGFILLGTVWQCIIYPGCL